MSGGSFNYEYCKINDLYVGKMQDADLDEMMEDLCNVLHDLEWWQSCDYGEETYRNSAKAFKQKWLRGYDWETDERIDRAKKYIKSQIEEAFKKI
jgi:hypothetical protein